MKIPDWVRKRLIAYLVGVIGVALTGWLTRQGVSEPCADEVIGALMSMIPDVATVGGIAWLASSYIKGQSTTDVALIAAGQKTK